MPSVVLKNRIAAIIVVLFLVIAVNAPTVLAEYSNPAIAGKDSSAYWLDQAGLLSAYGNYPGAVRAYQKSLSLDPGKGEAHFGLGVALGAIGDFPGALASIDKAIALTPDNDRYHYGRGWIMMLAGRDDDALPHLRKAGALGNSDAQEYLRQYKP